MSLSRRDLMKKGASAIPALLALRSLGVSTAFGAPGAPARNIVFVELQGGNDGLNTIVPFGVNGGAYYDLYRPNLGVPESQVLKIAGKPYGFHPSWKEMRDLYLTGRLAVMQGVGYPNPNLSHDYSARIWRSGLPSAPGTTGWLGRYLSLYPKPSFPFATEIGDTTTLLTAGAAGEIPAIGVIEAFNFPFDYAHPEDGPNRRKAYESMVAASLATSGMLQSIGATSDQLLELVDTLKTVPQVQFQGAYPAGSFSLAMQIVLRLLSANLGLRFFRVQYGNFDTHADQNKDGFHSNMLALISQGLAAFRTDLGALGLGSNTLIVVTSEFGRTLRENASGGTDHGTVNPVFVLGDTVHGGFLNPHPSLDPAQLDPTGEISLNLDYRDVLGTLVMKWLGESQATATQLFGGYVPQDLGFI